MCLCVDIKLTSAGTEEERKEGKEKGRGKGVLNNNWMNGTESVAFW